MWEKQGPQTHGQRSLASSVTKGQYGELRRNVLIAPRYPGLLLSNGYLQGLYGARQPAAQTVVAVGGHRRGGDWRDLWNYRSGRGFPYIWRDISRSLDLGITQVGTPRLWDHDDLSTSPVRGWPTWVRGPPRSAAPGASGRAPPGGQSCSGLVSVGTKGGYHIAPAPQGG